MRDLTNLDPALLEALYNDASRDWLTGFVESEVHEAKIPAISSARDFVEVVHQLGRSNRAWSQRFGVLVIELSEGRVDTQDDQISARLTEFAQACPWKFLRESARRKLR